MSKFTTFRRDKIFSGMWIHGRSHNTIGWLIRFAENRWEHRTCDKLGVPDADVWGNHDGIMIGPNIPHAGPDWCIGEALAQGNVLTSVEEYEKQLAAGSYEVRVFQPAFILDDVRAVCYEAARKWTENEEGHGYDYTAYIGLMLRCFLGMNDWNTDERNRFYCTEAVETCFKQAGLDILQDRFMAPFHVEQVAGLIPKPVGRQITLKEITSEMMA